MNPVDKSKTLIKFGLYMLFLTVVIGLVITSGATPAKNRTNDETRETRKTYLEKEKELIDGEYNYVFRVDDGLITFEGNFKDGIRKGKKKDNDNTIQYEEGIEIYKVIDNQKEKYEDLYDGLDEQLFDFKSLFDILNSESCLIERNDDQVIYSYTEVLGYDFIITSDSLHIIHLQIDGLHNYEYEFTY